MGVDAAIWSLGLMSGTSLDGVDAALVRTDGETVAAFGPTLFRAYTVKERAVLGRALADATAIDERGQRPGAVAEAERIVTDAHAAVVLALAEEAKAEGIAPEVVGFHGQTVFHAPKRGLTVQIGDARRLAERVGLPVVHDFRAADVAAGGEGAPLVPVFHRALALGAGLDLPVAMLNVGGVANVTLIGADRILAFDTGPGNALIDDTVREATGRSYDTDGALAAAGTVDEGVLATLLDHPFFSASAPKSLDRNAFSRVAAAGLPLADRVATLTAFTAETVAIGLRLAGIPVGTVVVSGGGARNPTLLSMIGTRCGTDVRTAASLGFDGDFMEAQAFAYLAVRRLRGLPSTWPTTSGAPRPIVCGDIEQPAGCGWRSAS